MPKHPLLTRIAERIAVLAPQASGVARPGLLVALSGGPDSVALLLGAREWSRSTGGPLEAAHLNHTLRAAAAEEDMLFCRELCRGLGVPLHEFRRDPRPLARARGLGLEEAGRHLRRRLLAGVVGGCDHLHCVATGHHADDQTETVVMRLFRGAGPQGLRGLRPVQGDVIHPLLDIGHDRILACLQDCGQPWRLDASNEGRGNLRARLRNELLPLARDIFGDGCLDNPARLAALLEQDVRLLQELADRALAEVRSPQDAAALSVAGLLALDPALAGRALRSWLADAAESPDRQGVLGARLGRVHADLVLRWLGEGQSGTGLDLPGGWRLERDFDLLRLRSRQLDAPPSARAADLRVLVRAQPPAAAGAATADPAALGRLEGPGRAAGAGAWELTCPAEALRGDLRVRHPRRGDRLRPLGAPGTRKLSDVLREAGVPAADRAGALVVEDGEGILWVVGVARGERTRLLPTTGKTVTICICSRN